MLLIMYKVAEEIPNEVLKYFLSVDMQVKQLKVKNAGKNHRLKNPTDTFSGSRRSYIHTCYET